MKKFGFTLLLLLTSNIYSETINGHTLPPEPDPKINNSTLLGIDSNHNGVRDDVERWIYQTYKDKHSIHIDIAMQAGKAWQKVLEYPSRAKEIHDYVSAPIYCEGYYKLYASEFNDPILVTEEITTEYFRQKIIFNTNDRLDVYFKYNLLLSGDSYTVPWPSEGKGYCDFNTSKYE